MKKEITYEKAYSELEAIVADIENEKTPLDVLSKKTTRAVELITFCRNKLRTLEVVVNNNLETPEE